MQLHLQIVLSLGRILMDYLSTSTILFMLLIVQIVEFIFGYKEIHYLQEILQLISIVLTAFLRLVTMIFILTMDLQMVESIDGQ